ncbi:MAG: DUF4175 family protein [Paracoccaceae bacterium]
MNHIWARYADKRYGGVMRALRLRLALSRAALWLEVLTRRFWGVVTLGLFFYAFAAFGGLALFSESVGRVLVVVGLLAVGGMLILGARGLKIPDRDAAIDRFDLGVDGAPLASLRDHSATGKGDDLTRALWDLHQEKMAEQAAVLWPLPPDLRLASFDRYGLRLMALVCAATAVVFAPTGALDNVQQAMALPIFGGAAGASIEAWATPPAYTGKLQVYLGDVTDDVILDLPVGTEIVMQVYGGSDDVTLDATVSGGAAEFTGDKTTVRNAKITVMQAGDIEVRDGNTVLGAWRIIAAADNVPHVIAKDALGQTASAAMRLPFQATDDYGIVTGSAEVSLDLTQVDRRFGLKPEPAPRSALVASLPLPYRGGTQDISEVFIEDFSADLWVGMPVMVTLSVHDAAGQSSVVEVRGALPGKHFFVPLAAALVEQRRDLLWSPDNDIRVSQVLRALTNLPEDLGLASGTYLQVRAAVRLFDGMLENGVSAEERVEITQTLWEIAVFLEDGDLADARERLQRAQEKLLQAIEQQAEREEISSLMEELREATDEYLEMLASESEQERQSAEMPTEQSGGNDRLRQMLDDLQRMAENGESDAARELLEEMREIMENMQTAESEGGAMEQMEMMQGALGQQQELSDETFQELQEQLESGEDVSPETEQNLSARQEALREFLDSLRGQMSDAAREPTAEANENMEASRDFLGEGELGRALTEQAEAIENLRESIRRLGEEMQQAGHGRNGLQEGDTMDNPAGDDPLGRPLGRTGTTESGETFVPDMNASERARELLDEIRRRSGDVDRPDAEIDYLKRLLERF